MYRTREQMKQCTLDAAALVKDAARRLDELQLGLVCVVDEDEKLLGILTNGDFRRFILRGGRLDDPVTAAMNDRPRTVQLTHGGQASLVATHSGVNATQHSDGGITEHLASLLSTKDIRYVPIVDLAGRLIDIAYATDTSPGATALGTQSSLDCDAVVMAGGKGTRLDPLTRVLPKPLIPIGHTPIIELIMQRFAAHGVKRFHISVHHKANLVRAYLEESGLPYDVQYLTEPYPLGTAGALRGLLDNVSKPFFVTNCDILIATNYASLYEFHETEHHALTVVVAARQHTIPYCVCELDVNGHLHRIKEKPFYDILVNTGLYVLSPKILTLLQPDSYCDMPTLIDRVLESQQSVGVFPVSGDAFIDIGAWKEYRAALQLLSPVDPTRLDQSE